MIYTYMIYTHQYRQFPIESVQMENNGTYLVRYINVISKGGVISKSTNQLWRLSIKIIEDRKYHAKHITKT